MERSIGELDKDDQSEIRAELGDDPSAIRDGRYDGGNGGSLHESAGSRS